MNFSTWSAAAGFLEQPARARATLSARMAARRVMDLLCDLNQREGLGIFVSLHQVDYALRYCRRIVALKDGRIAYDGPPEKLDRTALVEIYGPEIEDVFWEGSPA